MFAPPSPLHDLSATSPRSPVSEGVFHFTPRQAIPPVLQKSLSRAEAGGEVAGRAPLGVKGAKTPKNAQSVGNLSQRREKQDEAED